MTNTAAKIVALMNDFTFGTTWLEIVSSVNGSQNTIKRAMRELIALGVVVWANNRTDEPDWDYREAGGSICFNLTALLDTRTP